MSEVLEAQFSSHKEECEKDRANLWVEVKSQREALDNKVPWSHFWTILGVLITIVGGLFSFVSYQISVLSSQIEQGNKTSASIQSDVSFLKGKLAPFDIQYTK